MSYYFRYYKNDGTDEYIEELVGLEAIPPPPPYLVGHILALAHFTTKSNSTFIRMGYILLRWDTNASGTGTSYNVETLYTLRIGLKYPINKEEITLNLYAIWYVPAQLQAQIGTASTVSLYDLAERFGNLRSTGQGIQLMDYYDNGYNGVPSGTTGYNQLQASSNIGLYAFKGK
jgi:hypothetical protein